MAAPIVRSLLIALAIAGGTTAAACTNSEQSRPAHPTAADAGPQTAGSYAGTSAGTSAGTAQPVSGRRPRTMRSPPPTGPRAPYPTPRAGKVPRLQRDQSGVLAALPGSGTLSCAVVGGRADVRAGGVAAGNFARARTSYAEQVSVTEVPSVFLYLIPKVAGSVSTATVEVRRLPSGTAQTVISRTLQQAGEWRYFALQIPIPSPGTYRLTMAAGADRGCFEVRFTS